MKNLLGIKNINSHSEQDSALINKNHPLPPTGTSFIKGANNKAFKKAGFTLAEVLITLGIIGVVAAMTIPTLINTYQKIVLVNKLKVEYSKFSNLITRSVYENGSPVDWNAEFNNITSLSERSKLITEKYIIPYLDGDVKPFGPYEYGTVWSLSGKASFFHYYVSGKSYRIKNGTIFRFSVTDDNKFILLLDIDNQIKSNRVGKDVFMFVINTKSNKLEPFGVKMPRNTLTGVDKDRWCKPPECDEIRYVSGVEACNKEIQLNDERYRGAFCTALIVRDGWKISDDYPW